MGGHLRELCDSSSSSTVGHADVIIGCENNTKLICSRVAYLGVVERSRAMWPFETSFPQLLVVALLIADWLYVFLEAAIVVVDSTSNVSLFFSVLPILQHRYLFHITEP